jgi:hypothetical protein
VTPDPTEQARTLSAQQRNAIDLMRECAGYDNGWAVICSSAVPSFKADGQAWIHWQTALSLVRRDLAEHDEDMGLIRLWEVSDDG